MVVLEVSPRAAKVMVEVPAPFSIQRLQAHTVAEDADDPVAALRALLDAQPLGAKEVGLLFGREMFSLRTLELPSTDSKEITSMLELQLGKLTPYPRAEIVSAWAVIGSFRDGYTSVLLAIGRKTLIDGVLQFLKTKGVTPRWAGVSTEGLEAWAAHTKQGLQVAQGQLVALVDIDFASTDCAILSSDGRLLFTHSIGIGHDQLSASPEAVVRLAGELIRLPRILVHEEITGTIGRGLVTGAAVATEQLVAQLAAQWGIAVDVVDSLEPFAPGPLREQAEATHASFTPLLGFLVSKQSPRIDLIPQEVRVSQALRVRSVELGRLAGSLAAILLLVGVFYVERILLWRRYLAQLRQQLTTVEQTSRDVLQRQQAMQRIHSWLDPSRSALEVLRAIAEAVGPEVTITQLAYAEQEPVKLLGKASTMTAPFELIDRLKQPGFFASVHSRSVSKARGSGSAGAEFEIVCELAPPS